MTLNGDNWEVTGVTSWGRGCASSNYPGVYANSFGKEHLLLKFINSAVSISHKFVLIFQSIFILVVRQWIADTTEATECPRA